MSTLTKARRAGAAALRFLKKYSWALLLVIAAAAVLAYLVSRKKGGANVAGAIEAVDAEKQREGEQAAAHGARANEAEQDVRAAAVALQAIQKSARENGNESMAGLVDRFNQRLRSTP